MKISRIYFGTLKEYARYFQDFVVSRGGSKIAFLARLNFYADRHLYLPNSDGTGLVDLSGSLFRDNLWFLLADEIWASGFFRLPKYLIPAQSFLIDYRELCIAGVFAEGFCCACNPDLIIRSDQ